MRKPTVTLTERIAVRAYFMWQHDDRHLPISIARRSAETYWLKAERIELDIATKRSASARKAAATRRDNAVVKASDASEHPLQQHSERMAAKRRADAKAFR